MHQPEFLKKITVSDTFNESITMSTLVVFCPHNTTEHTCTQGYEACSPLFCAANNNINFMSNRLSQITFCNEAKRDEIFLLTVFFFFLHLLNMSILAQ